MFVLGFEGRTGLGSAQEPSVLGPLALVPRTPLLLRELREGEKGLLRGWAGFLGEQTGIPHRPCSKGSERSRP